MLALLAYGGWYAYTNYYQVYQDVQWPQGILVPSAPFQGPVNAAPWQWRDYTITPRATYKIDARVLATKRYYDDIGPYDFALGWQEMSDSRVLDQLEITQAARFYHYHWANMPPADPQVIVRTSANTHLLPANDTVQRQLSRIHKGQVIHLEGYLISVNRSDGWHWHSSMTRDDSGAGACEVMWVESVGIYQPPAHT